MLSFTPGFSASDIPECGAVVWAYGVDKKNAFKSVENLSEHVNNKEPEWWVDLYGPDQAVQKAILIAENAAKPVLIADTQDNPRSGGQLKYGYASSSAEA